MPIKTKKSKCKTCGAKFEKKSIRHAYCCRTCFRKSLRKGMTTHPLFSCPECGKQSMLDFFPKKNLTKWKNFICPNCGYQRGE